MPVTPMPRGNFSTEQRAFRTLRHWAAVSAPRGRRLGGWPHESGHRPQWDGVQPSCVLPLLRPRCCDVTSIPPLKHGSPQADRSATVAPSDSEPAPAQAQADAMRWL